MAFQSQSGPPPDPAFLAQSRVPEILFGSVFPAMIATIFVLARFYSRAVIMKIWGWDDSWMLLSWLNGGLVLMVLNCVLTHFGAGRHAILLTLPNIQKLSALGTVCRLLYTTCLLTTKISICALYLRLFVERRDRIIVWSIVTYHTLFNIPLFFGLVFRCSPIQANWTLVPGKCLPYKMPLIAGATLNIFGDMALLAFIIPKLSTLQIGQGQRNFLIGVMGMGVLVIIAAIVRLIRTIEELNSSTDIPFASYDVVIWTSIEVCTGLACAAAPATRPFVTIIAPCLFASLTGDSLDNTAARRRNYADGTANMVEIGGQEAIVIGKSGISHGHGIQELCDLGGLLKNEHRSVEEL